MIFDGENLFSHQQALTASAASSNVIDLGAAEQIGAGEPIYITCRVTEDFNNLTNMRVALQTSDDGASWDTVLETDTVALADLKQGYTFPLDKVPASHLSRYVRLYYTITGSAPTHGKVSAALVRDLEAYHAYPDAL